MNKRGLLFFTILVALSGCGQAGGGGNSPHTSSVTVIRGVPTALALPEPSGGVPPYQFSLTTAAQNGLVQWGDQASVTYTAATGYLGADTFSYTLADLHGNTSAGTITIAVAAPVQDNAVLINGLGHFQLQININVDIGGLGRGDVSADGRYVVVASPYDLEDGGAMYNGYSSVSQIYRFDRQTGTSVLVSCGIDGLPLPNSCEQPVVSDSGTIIAFTCEAESTIYVKDMASGVLTDEFNTPAGQASISPSFLTLSGDGQRLVFQNYGLTGTLPNGDFVLENQIILRDRTMDTFHIISQAGPGMASTEYSWFPALSRDGTSVAYLTYAPELLPAGTPAPQVVRTRIADGVTELVSRNSAGMVLDDYAEGIRISGDGQRIVFTTESPVFDPAPQNSYRDVFLKDMDSGDLTCLSVDANGAPRDQLSLGGNISADGNWLSLITQASFDSLVDNAAVIGRTFSGTHWQRVNLSPTHEIIPVSIDSFSEFPALSADGFWSVLLGDGLHVVDRDHHFDFTIFPRPQTWKWGAGTDAGVTDDGHVAFIGAEDVLLSGNPGGIAVWWSPNDESNRAIFLTPSGAYPNAGCTDLAVADDGSAVVVTSAATDVDPEVTEEWSQVWLLSPAGGAPVCASTNSVGEPGSAPSLDGDVSDQGLYVVFLTLATNLGGGPSDTYHVARKNMATGILNYVDRAAGDLPANNGAASPKISADGRYVAFISAAGDLVPDDGNADIDLYWTDMVSGEMRCVSRFPNGIAIGGISDYDLSADGQTLVFISNKDGIVAEDDDERADAFLYRIADSTIIRISTDVAGNGIGPVSSPCVDGAGNRVVFVCQQDDLDPSDHNGGPDMFVKDITTGALRLVSRTAAGSASRLWAFSGPQCSATDINRSGTLVVGTHTGIDLTPERSRSAQTYLFSIPATGAN